MSTYHVRPATLDDLNALVHHRIGMFTEMGVPMNSEAVAQAFREWLSHAMPGGVYRSWVAIVSEEIVAGAGITILPWPPGPRSLRDRAAFVYNVYTEPAHRRRGLGRLLMDTIHVWCRGNGLDVVMLNASVFGRPLYESMGYQVVPDPMMVLGVRF
jgi:GNAT superfamily N-acetyltransferase